MNYDTLLKITREVPDGLKVNGRKPEPITPGVRQTITERDCLTCQICDVKGQYGNKHWGIEGNLNIHHIIPNGPATEDNLITLCKYCHTIVHHILYVSGKWYWVPRIQ
jgi:5-methylcytosine-specific restriction endonuclease McrA